MHYSTYEKCALAYLAIAGIVGTGLLLYELRVVINKALDRLQELARRPMATKMSRAQIMRRRLERSVSRRMDTIREANRG
jgi:hypothetical protein